MKLAAFGDIHSNHIALEACFAEAEKHGADGLLFLGDYISDCACPQKTLALLRDMASRYRCWFIRGNREEYMIDHADGKSIWNDNSQHGSLLYTYENLTSDDIAWFRSLPIVRKVDIEGAPSFEICHGALWKSRAMLLPGHVDFEQALAQMETDLLLCAHTHKTFIAKQQGKTIVNGGSVGLPCTNKPGATFAMLELADGHWQPQLFHVSYDVEAVVQEFYDSGFMDQGRVWARAITKTLRTGQDYSIPCIEIANQYAQEHNLPYDHEESWEWAAEKLGIDRA